MSTRAVVRGPEKAAIPATLPPAASVAAGELELKELKEPKRGLPSIPTTKLYFSISEVSEITGVKPHVLRYWESEFGDLKPKKNRAGNRSYRDKDIKMVITIRDLLWKQGFTIAGARMQLRNPARREEAAAAAAAAAAATNTAAATLAAVRVEARPALDGDKTHNLLRIMKRELQELRKRLD